MSLIVAASDPGRTFTPAPAGPQPAVCSAVFDIGEEWSEKYNKLSHKVVIFWELAEAMEDGRPFMLSCKYTASLSEKANLRRDLEAWRGRAFTSDELKGFDLAKLVGVNCTLNVMHQTGTDGKVRAVVKGVMPSIKGAAKMTVTSTDIPQWAQDQRAKNLKEAERHKATQAAPPPVEDDEPVVLEGAEEPPF